MKDKRIPRRFGQWAGEPNGWAEDPTRCVQEVYRDVFPHQCLRKRGHGRHGAYCHQHAKKNEK